MSATGGPGGCKSGAQLVWRWLLLCTILGTTVVAMIFGFFVGFSNLLMSQQSPALYLRSSLEASSVLPGAQFHPQLCKGKRLFIYDLPPLFNSEILDSYCHNITVVPGPDPVPVPDMCADLVNSGMGVRLEQPLDPVGAWYRTHQFSLDLLFHERVKHYPCITNDSETADLFYAPYYVALDVTRYLFSASVQFRDKLSQRFLGWLMAQSSWNRLQGHKHVLILARIVWDFSRHEEMDNWGGALLSNWEVRNMTALLLERDSSDSSKRQIGVPYPTSFHPKSDEELELWQHKVATSKRDILVSFAGAPRSKTKSWHPNGSLRDSLLAQCTLHSNLCTLLLCHEVDCEHNPHLVTNLVMRSTFCLQPPGDSPTRKSVFDCLLAGSIPVFFNVDTAYIQYLWHLPRDGDSYSILFDEREVVDKGFDVIAALCKISPKKIQSMQQKIVREILPTIVYDHPQRDPNKKAMDAVDIILAKLFDDGFQTYTS